MTYDIINKTNNINFVSLSLQLQAKASSATYNEFQNLKTGVLQQSSDIVTQSEAMLELMTVMSETCSAGTLEKPTRHIQVLS